MKKVEIFHNDFISIKLLNIFCVTEILHSFAKMLSKSSTADLLYVGKRFTKVTVTIVIRLSPMGLQPMWKSSQLLGKYVVWITGAR